jgi:hypothetical protein
MYDNWAEVRHQLDQELARERQQRQANRGQQPSLWLSPWQSLWRSLRTARLPFLVRPMDKVELTQTCDGFMQVE